MTQPIRVRLSRAKGFKLPPNTVVVARPGKWGNPFIVGKHGNRATCIDYFRKMAEGFVFISLDAACADAQVTYHATINAELPALRGKNLACWCVLDAPCHADVLLELANRSEESK